MWYVAFVAVKLLTVALGFLVAYQAYRGYRRNGATLMLAVAVGFVLMSVGGVLEGVLYEGFALSTFEAGFVSSLLVAAGLCAVCYALYAPEP